MEFHNIERRRDLVIDEEDSLSLLIAPLHEEVKKVKVRLFQVPVISYQTWLLREEIHHRALLE